MTTEIKVVALAGGLLLSAFVLSSGNASAMPLLDAEVATAADVASANVNNVRWVCGPYRCWWRPNYYYGYYRGYYRPRPYGWYRPYGWRRPYGWGYPYGW